MWLNIVVLVSSVLTHATCIFRNDFDSVGIIFYHGPTFNDNAIYDLNNAITVLNHTLFDPSKNTTLYIHGYSENQESESIVVIVNAYNLRGSDNLLVLDWAQLVTSIRKVFVNYTRFGAVLADKLIELFNAGLNLETFNLVGHSLGGHLVGYVGREIIKKTGGQLKVPRITTLDPAFPGGYGIFWISRNDGDFVQSIHTSTWSYGSPLRASHVDFWPNGGRAVQPGCPRRYYILFSENDLCSHRRSWRYFAEAVASRSDPFYAIKAISWRNFRRGIFSTPQSVIIMGSDTPTSARGSYYFTTNTEPPYSRGIEGIQAS